MHRNKPRSVLSSAREENETGLRSWSFCKGEERSVRRGDGLGGACTHAQRLGSVLKEASRGCTVDVVQSDHGTERLAEIGRTGRWKGQR
jgi:hypothetical protein